MQTIFENALSKWMALSADAQDAFKGEDEIDRFVDFANSLLATNPAVGFTFNDGRQCLYMQDQTYLAVSPPINDGMTNSPTFGVTQHMAGPNDKGRTIQEPSFGV